MSKLLCNVLKISGGANAPNTPPWLRVCLWESHGKRPMGWDEMGQA